MSEFDSAAEPAAAEVETDIATEETVDEQPADEQPPAAEPAAPSEEAPAPAATSDAETLANWREKLNSEVRTLSGAEGQPADDAKPADDAEAKAAKAPDAEHPDEKEPKPEPAKEPEKQEEPDKKPAEDEKAKDDEEAKAEDDAQKPLIPKVAFEREPKSITNFDRVPKEARKVIAEYADAGEAMQKLLNDNFGGEAFIAPLTRIVSGLQSEDNLPVFTGLIEATGIDGLAKLVDDTMRFAMIEAAQDDKPDSDGGAYLQSKLKETTAHVIEALFGEEVTADYIKKLVAYDKGGHLNTEDVDKFFADNPDADPQKATPAMAAKEARIKELEQQLEATKGKPDADNAKREAQITSDFDANLTKHSHASLNDLVIKKSVLKAIDTDAPEIAAAKTVMRDLLQTQFDTQIKSNSLYGKLRDGAVKGEVSTANFQKRLTSVVDSALMKARETKAPLEALLASIMDGQRNVKLLEQQKKAPAGDDGTPKEPTQTKKSENKPEDMTLDDWRKHLREQTTGAAARA